MKWEFKKVGSAGGWVTLLDVSAGDASRYYKPSFKDGAMITQGFGADSQGIAATGNTICALEIHLTRTYVSSDATMDGVIAMRALKTSNLHLRFTHGTKTHYYPNASLTSMSADVVDRGIDFVFLFQTQDVQSGDPS